MAECVGSREWRRKLREVRHEHTTEVRAETLSPEVAEIVTEMAHQVARINLELADAKARLAAIEALPIDRALLKGAA